MSEAIAEAAMPLTVYGIWISRNNVCCIFAAHSSESASRAISDMTAPPEPPIRLTPAVACSPDTDVAVLWHIAYHVPELRKWLVANPKADAPLLELVSQRGGPVGNIVRVDGSVTGR